MRPGTKVRGWITVIVALLVMSGMTSTASASDTVQVSVTPIAPPTPIVTEHGNGRTPGDIVLDYVVVGYAFPTGLFASFNVNFAMQPGTGSSPVYPVALSLIDIGSPNVNMTAVPNPLSITSAAWTGSTVVDIHIPADVALDPSLSVDGAEIVGNLKMETPAKSKVDTPTTIKVRIRLVHPTACVRFFNFISDTDLLITYSSVDIKIHKDFKVGNMQPGQLSDNLLVVNTCVSAQTLDLQVSLDPLFTTSPVNNPGNAVFTYTATGAIDPATLVLSSFGAGTPKGQALCLQNLSIAPGTTLLTTVKMDLATPAGMVQSQLPEKFVFGGALYTAGSGCTGVLASEVSPNPVSVDLLWAPK